MSDDHDRTWNRFSADFHVPDNNDAALVANQAKAAIDSWVQKSMADMQADMTARLQVHLIDFKTSIDQSNAALNSVDSQIASIRSSLDKLAAANPPLANDIATLQKQTDTARTAMDAAVKQWEDYGKNSISTIIGIAKTVGTFA